MGWFSEGELLINLLPGGILVPALVDNSISILKLSNSLTETSAWIIITFVNRKIN